MTVCHFTVDDDVAAVRRVFQRHASAAGHDVPYGGRDEIRRCCDEIAAAADCRYALLTSSATAALTCALASLQVGPGDEVVVPGFSGLEAALAVLHVGAVPVLAEIDETGTLDVPALSHVISPQTRLIVAVHVDGSPCDMAGIFRVTDSLGVGVLEYAQRSIGGRYRGRHLGTLGEIGVVSLGEFGGTGPREAGVILTSSPDLHNRATAQADAGFESTESSPPATVVDGERVAFAGWDFRTTELEAAVIRSRLGCAPNWIERLRVIKQRLYEGIDAPGVARVAHCHDVRGDCGRFTLMTADSARAATALIGALKERRIHAVTPYHFPHLVFRNWRGVINRQGSHHPLLNPYLMPQNHGLRTADRPEMLPRTDKAVRCSVVIPTDDRWSNADVLCVLRGINEAIRVVSS